MQTHLNIIDNKYIRYIGQVIGEEDEDTDLVTLKCVECNARLIYCEHGYLNDRENWKHTLDQLLNLYYRTQRT